MYAKLFEKLHSRHVEYLILGGAAVSLHGFARLTADIDILLQNSSDNINRFVSAASEWGDGCGAGLTYDDFQGPGCVRIEEDFPLDVFTVLDGKPYEYFAPKTVTHTLADGLMLPCLSVNDLIDLKKKTLREKDELDVAALQSFRNKPSQNPNPIINLEPPPEA